MSNRLEQAVRTCDNMRPDISPYPEVADFGNIRNLLYGFPQNVNSGSSRLARVSNRNERKQLEESLLVWCLTKCMLTTITDFDTALVLDKYSGMDIVSVYKPHCITTIFKLP